MGHHTPDRTSVDFSDLPAPIRTYHSGITVLLAVSSLRNSDRTCLYLRLRRNRSSLRCPPALENRIPDRTFRLLLHHIYTSSLLLALSSAPASLIRIPGRISVDSPDLPVPIRTCCNDTASSSPASSLRSSYRTCLYSPYRRNRSSCPPPDAMHHTPDRISPKKPHHNCRSRNQPQLRSLPAKPAALPAAVHSAAPAASGPSQTSAAHSYHLH